MKRLVLVAVVVAVATLTACVSDGGDRGAPASAPPTTSTPITATTTATTMPTTTTSTRQPATEKHPFLVVGEDAFAGQVVGVDFAPEYGRAKREITYNANRERVGPFTLHFDDGASLYVPRGTRGENTCVELIRDIDWPVIVGEPNPTQNQKRLAVGQHCFVYGALTAENEVAWFRVAEWNTSKSWARSRGVPVVDVDIDGIVVNAAANRTAPPILVKFLFSEHTTIGCHPTYDLTPAEAAEAEPQGGLKWYWYVDVETGRVHQLGCA